VVKGGLIRTQAGRSNAGAGRQWPAYPRGL
jgi:hypothetical protein